MIIPLLLLLTFLPDKKKDLDSIRDISYEPFSFYKEKKIRARQPRVIRDEASNLNPFGCFEIFIIGLVQLIFKQLTGS